MARRFLYAQPGVVGTAINGTIRLQSDFEVRYSTLIPIFIILISLEAGSRSTHSVHLAILRSLVIIIFMPSSIDDDLNGWISSQPPNDD